MWAAANSNPPPNDSDWDSESSGERSTTESIHDDGNIPTTHNHNSKRSASSIRRVQERKKKKRRREETPEATMARLTMSYSTAMEAVGALHRVSRQIWRERGEVVANGEDGEIKQDEDPVGDGDAAVEKKGADDVKRDTDSGDAQVDGNNDESEIQGKDQCKETTGSLHEEQTTIRKVAQSARSLLEQSLLLDPILMAPILLPSDTTKNARAKNTFDDMNIPTTKITSAWSTAWNANSSATMNISKWKKLSAAHKSTSQQISYLSLVNYADLLLCGCNCNHSQTGDILDRRPVSSLEALKLFEPTDSLTKEHSAACLWPESKEQTLRLALASYCDASELDPTDPTLWLKVACTARSLGRVVDSPSDGNTIISSLSTTWRPTSYRSLERLAIQRGLDSLPRNIPPNRMLVRAQKEMERWDRTHGRTSEETEKCIIDEAHNEPLKLVIHLPEYSWCTLGRILIRACKEGAGYGRSGSVSHVWSTNCNADEDYEFGSPMMDIRISPMLCFSRDALAVTCQYLGRESRDLNSLACTCKALPLEIQSAMAGLESNPSIETSSLDHKDEENAPTIQTAVIDQAASSVTEQIAMEATTPQDRLTNNSDEVANMDESNKAAPSEVEGEKDDNTTPIKSPADAAPTKSPSRVKRSNSNSPRPIVPGERISKRVRSQMLTSEKETERQAKRSSVEYCFLSGMFSCTSQDRNYVKLLKSNFDWKELSILKSLSGTQSGSLVVSKDALSEQKSINSTSAGRSTLGMFLETTQPSNSGPRHLLDKFLVYTAMHPAMVFGDPKRDPTSCILDCFGLLTTGKGGSIADAESNFVWYGNDESSSFVMDAGDILQIFAVNLLASELRFKIVSRDDCSSSSDAQILASAIPILIKFDSSIITNCKEHKDIDMIIELRCRCYWLICQYYLWLSRCNDDTLGVGEKLGMEYLTKSLKALSSNDSKIKRSSVQIYTPQLQSTHREGRHWSVLSIDSLKAYSEEVQSSSVVSRARNVFRDISHTLQEDPSPNHTDELVSIGKELLDWYCKGDGVSRGKFTDMVADFMVLHQDVFNEKRPSPEAATKASDWIGEFYWGTSLWGCVPSSKEASSVCIATAGSSRPSIIHVLACCLFASSDFVPSVMSMYTQLTLAALQMRVRLLLRNKDDPRIDVDLQMVQRDEQLLIAANYFMDKTISLLEVDSLDIQESTGTTLLEIVFETMNVLLIGDCEHPSLSQFHIFQSLSLLISALRSRKFDTMITIESIYFVSLAKLLVHFREYYMSILTNQDKRTKSCQIQLTRTLDFVSFIAQELAENLSLHPSFLDINSQITASPLIAALSEESMGDCLLPIAKLSEASLWFWTHVVASSEKADFIAASKRLLRPVAALIISLCGCGISIQNNVLNQIIESSEDPDSIGISCDYFDSDDSINGAFLNESNKKLLKRINQLVQCISLVYSASEKAVCYEYAPFMTPSCQHGPFLPLVVIRILSGISDNLFRLNSCDIWDGVYPYGARSCGSSLDNILASAYRSVYGITLVGQNQTSSEYWTNNSNIRFLPESIDAAAQLFRCVKRLHLSSRSLPARALEVIDKVLPSSQPTPVGAAIRDFLFDAKRDVVLSQYSGCVPADFPEWVIDECRDKLPTTGSETDRLRKMVSSELAKGEIKMSNADEDTGGLSEERELTRSHELSLYNKFRVLLDDLSNEPSNIEGWVVLSETCGFKADIICDRLVPIKETFQRDEFRPLPSSMRATPAATSRDELKTSQINDFDQPKREWVPFLGNDLSVYMEYPWSSLASLELCAKHIKSKLCMENTPELLMLRDLDAKYEAGDYISWANGWAGMFVLALRRMKLRALCVARYLAMTKKDNIGMHPSEVSEDIGTALYAELVGSTSYGYPMKVMGMHEKREIASTAKFFFEEAVRLSTSDNFNCKCETVLWENQFMIGKCHEKIASTTCEEVFAGTDSNTRRLYEMELTSALQTYSAAIADAKEREHLNGGIGKRDKGGSSHGSLEVFYRIHACRFKALVSSMRPSNNDRDLAQEEALRICSVSRFDSSVDIHTLPSHRHKMWDALVDCVKAFMECRKDEPKFHRVIFRLAQAYCWAPFFIDSSQDSSLGSEDTDCIPIFDGVPLPSIDRGSCQKNAALAIESLFDKRRSQICAVWVTTSSTPPPFEVLNDSIRKYDYLRLKYIEAYIDCMKKCKKLDKIETLLNHTATCAQDLAGFYQASAAVRFGDPGRHTKQSLLNASGFLAKVKRSANDALTELVLGDLAHLKRNGSDEERKTFLDVGFRMANSLFLQLNSSPENTVQIMISSKKPILQVIALCKCFISIQAGYRVNDSINFEELDYDTLLTFVEQALQKAKEMFPSKSKQQMKK